VSHRVTDKGSGIFADPNTDTGPVPLKIINGIGNGHPVSEMRKIVVIHRDDLLRVKRSAPIQKPQSLLLLCINTDNRIAHGFILGAQVSNPTKLRIPIGMLPRT